MDFTTEVSVESTVSEVEKIDDGVLLTMINDTKVFITDLEMTRIIEAYK